MPLTAPKKGHSSIPKAGPNERADCRRFADSLKAIGLRAERANIARMVQESDGRSCRRGWLVKPTTNRPEMPSMPWCSFLPRETIANHEPEIAAAY